MSACTQGSSSRTLSGGRPPGMKRQYKLCCSYDHVQHGLYRLHVLQHCRLSLAGAIRGRPPATSLRRGPSCSDSTFGGDSNCSQQPKKERETFARRAFGLAEAHGAARWVEPNADVPRRPDSVVQPAVLISGLARTQTPEVNSLCCIARSAMKGRITDMLPLAKLAERMCRRTRCRRKIVLLRVAARCVVVHEW